MRRSLAAVALLGSTGCMLANGPAETTEPIPVRLTRAAPVQTFDAVIQVDDDARGPAGDRGRARAGADLAFVRAPAGVRVALRTDLVPTEDDRNEQVELLQAGQQQTLSAWGDFEPVPACPLGFRRGTDDCATRVRVTVELLEGAEAAGDLTFWAACDWSTDEEAMPGNLAVRIEAQEPAENSLP